MTRAVIDPNILIGAIIEPQGTVGPVVVSLHSGLFQVVLSRPLLDELTATRVLPRIRDKYSLADEDIVDYLTFLALHARLVEPEEAVSACRDINDNMVLEAAPAGGAMLIVTGDEDLLTLNPFRGLQIVAPSLSLRSLQND